MLAPLGSSPTAHDSTFQEGIMRTFILSLAVVTALSGTLGSADAATTADENRAQTIAENLKQSGQLKDYRVGVKYEDGVAWLMGTVTSPQQKQVAEQLARQSAGVEHVVSKLEVEGGAAPQGEVSLASSQLRPSNHSPQQNRPQSNMRPRSNMPVPYARTGGAPVQPANFSQANYYPEGGGPAAMGPQPQMAGGAAVGYDNPQLPGYAWPSYAASPNYAALTYPKQYSASAWPYIGPFYPYPQVPLGWRKVTLEWDDGWWNLDFADHK
jgi:hypothetical protein